MLMARDADGGEVDFIAACLENLLCDGDGGEDIVGAFAGGCFAVGEQHGEDEGVHEVDEAAGVVFEFLGEDFCGGVNADVLEGVLGVYAEAVESGCDFFHGLRVICTAFSPVGVRSSRTDATAGCAARRCTVAKRWARCT